jgi:hypothetical protein
MTANSPRRGGTCDEPAKKERTKLVSPPSLQERVAAALVAEDITSAELASLIAEVEAAANDAEKTAKEAQERTLDPTVADPAAAREVQREAEFTTKRLDAALKPLDARLDEVRRAEDRKRWHADCDALEVQRDALAAELLEGYLDFQAKMPNLFARIAANDKALSKLHQARSAGVSRHLLGAELIARRLESFSVSNPSLAEELKLPDWQQSNKLVWPPPQKPLGVLMAESMSFAHPGGDWWQEREAHAAALRKEQSSKPLPITTQTRSDGRRNGKTMKSKSVPSRLGARLPVSTR